MTESRSRRGTVSIPGRAAAGGSLVDEIRAGVPATPAAAGRRDSKPAAAAAPVVAEPAPLPPPKKVAAAREQFSTKLPPLLIKDLRSFVTHYDAEIQTVVELAVSEYLTSRGWTLSESDGK